MSDLLTSTAPERIWLQISDDEDHRDEPFPHDVGEEITWCQDSVLACEVEYIRADRLAAAEARADALHKALRKYAIAQGWCHECKSSIHDGIEEYPHVPGCLAAPKE